MSDPEAAQSNRRLAIIVVSSFLLVAMTVAVTVGVSMNQNEGSSQPKDNNKHVSDSMKAVTAICRPTDYKEDCVNTLNAEAGNTTDPKDLIKVVFNVTIRSVGESLAKTRLIHDVESDPRTKMALDTCMQLMELSIGEFQKSVDNMGSFELSNVNNMLMNLKVWISGSITYQQTCLDGFENTTTDASQKMQDLLKLTMQRSSNLIAIINDFADSFAQLDLSTTSSRRLLQGHIPVLGHGDLDIPFWLQQDGSRRLLSTGKIKPNVIVAQDGSGMVKTVTDALNLVPANNLKPFIIYIKEGVYQEYVHVSHNMTHVVMIGDGGDKTRITGNKNFIDGIGTYRTATVGMY